MQIDTRTKEIQKNQHIGVLTYQGRHRKTYDILCLLKAKGYHNITVYAKAFHYQKKSQPLIEHRPSLGNSVDSEECCLNFGYCYQKIENYEDVDLPEESLILVGGAGIVPVEFIQKYITINAHPGYIPDVRGLDALKWAIIEGKLIGVTTHLIGTEIDAGQIIERRVVPLHSHDSFHTVAQRQYEMEIGMLVEAIEKVNEPYLTVMAGESELHKRMPCELELHLYPKFEKYKNGLKCKEGI